MLAYLDRFFGIHQKNSSFQTEILAGVSTFLALSYIFVVNPSILSQAGMDKNTVLFATIISSGLATLLMALWPRIPFVVAPGMEMNAYVAFYVIGTLGFSWQQALGACFWSGVIFIVLTLAHVRERIIEAIPRRMKSSLSLSVGIFLGLVALKVAGLLVYQGVTLHAVGNFHSSDAYALYASVAILLLLQKLRVPGAILVGMVLTALLCPFLGVGQHVEKAAQISRLMLVGVGHLDVGVLIHPRILSVILILFLIDFYGSVAKFIGLTLTTNIMVNGRLPRMKEALLVDGLATTVGAVLGTTSLTTYVESGVGIGVGGRTGLTALVCSILMLSCFLIAPLLRFVPVVATTGALLYVGYKLCPSLQELRTYPRIDLLVLVAMQVIVIITFAIDRAMLAGFLVYIMRDLFSRRRPDLYLVGSTVMLAFGVLLQIQ